MPSGRISRINDPEFAKMVAELYTSGVTRKEMAETLDCSEVTVTNWVRDPRVQAHASRFVNERVTRITRRIDSEMEARMTNLQHWDTKDLLAVRKEYLDRAIKIQGEGINITDTTTQLAEAMDADPDLAEQLRKLVGG